MNVLAFLVQLSNLLLLLLNELQWMSKSMRANIFFIPTFWQAVLTILKTNTLLIFLPLRFKISNRNYFVNFKLRSLCYQYNISNKADNFLFIGVILCLFPFPIILMYPSIKLISDIFKFTILVTLSPQEYKHSIIVRFLSLFSLLKLKLLIILSISSVLNTIGSFFF